MKALVRYVEQGGALEIHDVPNTIRGQLYAKERQQIEKRQKAPNPPPGSMLQSTSLSARPNRPSRQIIPRIIPKWPLLINVI